MPTEWALAQLGSPAISLGDEQRYMAEAKDTFVSPAGVGLSLPKLDDVIGSFAIQAGSIARNPTTMERAGAGLWLDAVTACVEALIAEYTAVVKQYPGLFAFWDAILPRPSTALDANLRSALADLMIHQLASDNEFVCVSALHGIGHLGDPRARQEVRRLIDLDSGSDLATYARQALSGNVL